MKHHEILRGMETLETSINCLAEVVDQLVGNLRPAEPVAPVPKAASWESISLKEFLDDESHCSLKRMIDKVRDIKGDIAELAGVSLMKEAEGMAAS